MHDKRVAILGIGIEGLALAQFLSDKSVSLTVLDKLSEGEIFERLEGEEKEEFGRINQNSSIKKTLGPEYLSNLSDFDIIFRSPGIAFNEKIKKAEQSGVLISSQIKLFFELCPCPIIGVTGTKGKGTTASLIFEILKKQNIGKKSKVYLAGNIGYPAITLIPNLSESDIVILELSSFQLLDLEHPPHIAVVTNLSEDHLDYHGDIAEYQIAKFNILKFQTQDDFAVLNADSTFSFELLDTTKSKKKFFSKIKEADAIVTNNNEVMIDPSGRNIRVCDQSEIKLFGVHNLENIAAATLVADMLNINSEIVKEAVKEFSGLPHRLEFVAEVSGVKYINDSYATNPDPTIAAIDSFSQTKILILGGSSKGADFSMLAQKIAAGNVSSVVLIDPEGSKIKTALIESGFKGRIVEGKTNIDEIVQSSSFEAKSGEIVILSPACASFGMFKNYKERGEKFKDAVLKLEKR